MLHRIVGSGLVTTPFFRFTTGSGSGLDPVFTAASATFAWINPDKSISTGTTPSPVLNETGDYTVKCSDWSDVTEFDCNSDDIEALDNLHVFSALTTLKCTDNDIVALNPRAIPTLTALHCNDNSLTALDVTTLVILERLDCYSNSIASLNVIALVALVTIHCADNGMAEAAVDDILADLVTAGASNGTITMAGTNAAPSGVGDKNILIGRGWTVTTS